MLFRSFQSGPEGTTVRGPTHLLGRCGTLRAHGLQSRKVAAEQVGKRAATGAEVLSRQAEIVGAGEEVSGHRSHIVEAFDGRVVLLAYPKVLIRAQTAHDGEERRSRRFRPIERRFLDGEQNVRIDLVFLIVSLLGVAIVRLNGGKGVLFIDALQLIEQFGPRTLVGADSDR